MPNWCCTQYAIIGERKEVRSLYNRMKRLQQRKTPLVENGFGVAWLGFLVRSLGRDPQSVYCRGSWQDLEMKQGGTLTFNTEHAWSRPSEVEDLIHEVYPSLRIYFLEEELGMDVFQTNDISGEYFKEQVIIDDESDGMEYYTEAAALQRLSELSGKTVGDWEEAEAVVRMLNDAQDAVGGEGHIWIHKAELC